MPITWRNIDAPNSTASATLLAGAQRSFDKAFEGVGGVLDAGTARRKEGDRLTSERFLDDARRAYDTPEALEAAQADGSIDALRGQYRGLTPGLTDMAAIDALVGQGREREIQQNTFEGVRRDERTLLAQDDINALELAGDAAGLQDYYATRDLNNEGASILRGVTRAQTVLDQDNAAADRQMRLRDAATARGRAARDDARAQTDLGRSDFQRDAGNDIARVLADTTASGGVGNAQALLNAIPEGELNNRSAVQALIDAAKDGLVADADKNLARKDAFAARERAQGVQAASDAQGALEKEALKIVQGVSGGEAIDREAQQAKRAEILGLLGQMGVDEGGIRDGSYQAAREAARAQQPGESDTDYEVRLVSWKFQNDLVDELMSDLAAVDAEVDDGAVTQGLTNQLAGMTDALGNPLTLPKMTELLARRTATQTLELDLTPRQKEQRGAQLQEIKNSADYRDSGLAATEGLPQDNVSVANRLWDKYSGNTEGWFGIGGIDSTHLQQTLRQVLGQEFDYAGQKIALTEPMLEFVLNESGSWGGNEDPREVIQDILKNTDSFGKQFEALVRVQQRLDAHSAEFRGNADMGRAEAEAVMALRTAGMNAADAKALERAMTRNRTVAERGRVRRQDASDDLVDQALEAEREAYLEYELEQARKRLIGSVGVVGEAAGEAAR